MHGIRCFVRRSDAASVAELSKLCSHRSAVQTNSKETTNHFAAMPLLPLAGNLQPATSAITSDAIADDHEARIGGEALLSSG